MSLTNQESLDDLLLSISESVDSTASVLGKIENDFDLNNTEIQNELVNSLVKTLDSSSNPLDSLSLLSLKNSALLGYVTDLALLMALRLKSLKEQDKNSLNQERDNLLKSTVTNRVVLEKGVKSLENKMSYQLEKMVNAYHRREKEQDDVEKKINENNASDVGDVGSSSEGSDGGEEEEEEEEEGLNFKPNPSALLNRKNQNVNSGKTMAGGDDNEGEAKSNEKYRPPKISATAINDPDKQVKGRKQRNLQSMDEYLQDISEAPSMEKSIGSTIINNGRDMKSKKQMEKEAEIQRYEEENFTRLPATKTKEDKRARAKRMRNEFMGEDWSMFDNNMNPDEASGAKKRKRLSAWERAKRKIDH